MNFKTVVFTLTFITLFMGCSGGVNYTPEYIEQTSGKYLYNQDDIIEVFYEKNTLFLNWRGQEKIKPLALDETTIFIEQLYKKLRFNQHPETKKWYLSEVSKEDQDLASYDYIKVDDNYITPSMHLKKKAYSKALKGYLEIQKQDSNSLLINEREFNRLGYRFLRDSAYADAIEVFKINVALYPESDNVYDSLGEGYLKSGDSLQAYENYKMALELDNGNRRAKRYIDAYEKR